MAEDFELLSEYIASRAEAGGKLNQENAAFRENQVNKIVTALVPIVAQYGNSMPTFKALGEADSQEKFDGIMKRNPKDTQLLNEMIDKATSRVAKGKEAVEREDSIDGVAAKNAGKRTAGRIKE